MKTRNLQSVIIGLTVILLLSSKLYSTEIRIAAFQWGGFYPRNTEATLGDTITWYHPGPKINPSTRCDGISPTILPLGASPWNHVIAPEFSYVIDVAGHYQYKGVGGSLDLGTIDVTASLNVKIAQEACSPNSDTMKVCLRKSSSPYELVDTAQGVLDFEGNITLKYSKVSGSTNYYIVGKHRNSIETWSKFPQTFDNGTVTYDFTTGINKAYGDNMVLVNGRASFYTGDVNQDGTVDGNDFALIENDVISFVPGYMVTDLNCDQIVDGTDFSYADNNVNYSITVIRP